MKKIVQHLFLLVVFIQTVLGVEEIKKAAAEAKCKGMDLNVSDEQMMVILECAQELGVMSKADLNPAKMACFSKCMIQKQGLVDAEGKIHKEKVIDSVDSSIPEAMAKDVKMHLTQCLDEHGSKIMPKEELCTSYEPLTKCIHDAYLHLCTDN